jgi:putative endonuclease
MQRPRPTSANLARGRWGEDLAAQEYRRRGFDIIDRNWRTTSGELDLVACRGRLVVFCEVKARRTADYGPPSAAVGPAKQQRIRTLAMEWLDAHRPGRVELRFDVVAITGTHLEVIEAAF